MIRGRRLTLLLIAIAVAFAVPLGFLLFNHSGRPAEHRTFALTVQSTTMTPSTLVAYGGDTVTIEVTADRTEELHLHGYDFFFDMQPGETQVKTFPADKQGAFTIEIEGSTLTNGTRLGELDVYPN
jgi:hypothetical protein